MIFTTRNIQGSILNRKDDLTPSPLSEIPLRILALCGGSYVSGLEIQALELFYSLQSRNNSIFCLASGWNNGEFIAMLQERDIAFDTIYFGKVTKSLRLEHLWWMLNTLWHWPGALLKLHRATESFHPDVILVFNRDAALLGFPVLRLSTCIFHVADLSGSTRWNRVIYQFLSRWVRGWIGVSEFVAKELISLGIPDEKISVIHNGITRSVVSGSAHRSNAQPIIGICGQIGPWKGHDDLFEALKIIKEKDLDFRCHIFGRGDEAYLESLNEIAVKSGIDAIITWRGFTRNIDEMYREIDILAVPSRFEEPFGLVAAEAGLNGLPVVVTRRGGLPEIVVDGETGFIVEAEAPNELADRLAQLIVSPSLRQQMGKAARQRVLKHFTIEHMTEGHEDALRRFAKGIT